MKQRIGLAFALLVLFFGTFTFASHASRRAQQIAQVGGLSFPGPGPRVTSGGGSSVAVTASSPAVISTAASTLTLPLTIPAGSNLAAAVMVTWASTIIPVAAAATWNGTAMTAVPSTASGLNGGCTCTTQIYGIVAPATGAHNFVVSWTGAVEGHAVAISFSGANQTSVAAAFPNGTFIVNNTAVASPATTTVTSATGHVVPAFATQQSSGWGTINGTTIATDSSTGPNLAVAGNYNNGAATVAPSFAFTGPGAWTIVATDVSP